MSSPFFLPKKREGCGRRRSSGTPTSNSSSTSTPSSRFESPTRLWRTSSSSTCGRRLDTLSCRFRVSFSSFSFASVQPIVVDEAHLQRYTFALSIPHQPEEAQVRRRDYHWTRGGSPSRVENRRSVNRSRSRQRFPTSLSPPYLSLSISKH